MNNQTIEERQTPVAKPMKIAKPYDPPPKPPVWGRKKTWSLMERIDAERRGIKLPPDAEPKVKLFGERTPVYR